MESLNNQLLKLKPHLSPKIWGTRRLGELKGLSNGEAIGESWEASILAEGPSIVEKSGESLDNILSKNDMPYLVKIIDTSDNLSIQVHPGDEYARVHENSVGKTECWLILNAEPGAGIYLGLKPGVEKQDLEKALADKADISELLIFYPVSKGDFFYVPAGSIHAIGKGVRLAEVQQSSGITYRVWDWNRMGTDGKPRELHVKKALDVINFEGAKNIAEYFRHQKELFNGNNPKFVEHDEFSAGIYVLNDNFNLNLKSNRAVTILNLEGSLSISRGNETVSLNEYESLVYLGVQDNSFELQPDRESKCLVVF